jgi:CheY-like chemotaxis protein
MTQPQLAITDKLKGWRILLVDDEPDNLDVAGTWLRLAGAEVSTAFNGRQGMELARQLNPHVILADLTMPVMDGWDMQHDLKNDILTSDIPVIALTAHTMQGVEERVRAAGFVDYIAKPLRGQAFVMRVYEIVNRTSRRPDFPN